MRLKISVIYIIILIIGLVSCSSSLNSKLIEADKLVLNNQTNEALLLYKELAESYPSAIVLSRYGSLLVNAGQISEGEAMLLKAASADQKDATTFYNLGIAQMMQGKRRKAIEYFTTAMKLSPKWTDPIWNRGTAYDELAEWEKAINDYNLAIELDPKNADIYNNRGVTLKSLGKKSEALSDFKKALELNPNHPNAKENLNDLINK